MQLQQLFMKGYPMAKTSPIELGLKHVARVQAKRTITKTFGNSSLIGALITSALFYLLRKK